MLYDPKWEVRADPFALESLIAWLEKHPPKKTYRYVCNGHCLLAQYFTACGYLDVEVTPFYFDHASGTEDMPEHFNEIALDDPDIFPFPDSKLDFDYTFGGALARARSLLPAHG